MIDGKLVVLNGGDVTARKVSEPLAFCYCSVAAKEWHEADRVGGRTSAYSPLQSTSPRYSEASNLLRKLIVGLIITELGHRYAASITIRHS